MNELGKRLGTAAVGVPLILAAFWLGGWWLLALVLVLCAAAFLELGNLLRAKGISHSTGWVLPYVLLMPPAAALPDADFLLNFGALTFGWLLLLLLRELFSSRREVLVSIGASMLAGLLAVLPFSSLIAIERLALPGGSRDWLMLALLCTWATDTFAYFGGRLLGRHKLFERVSPSKTVEGFLAGLAGSLAVGAALGAWFGGPGAGGGLLVGMVLGVSGPAGDLLESRLKRDAGIKDSAATLPGHGGVLDRFDSWTFAMPLLYLLGRFGLL